MSETAPFPEDLENTTENIYEAIMVIARRARKIGADQKLEIEKTLSMIEAEEEPDEETEVREKPVHDFEKPTMIAIRELRGSKLSYEYKDKF